MTESYKIKPKARLHVGAALNNVKLASTATSEDEFKRYVGAANQSLSDAMKLQLVPLPLPDKK